MGIAPGTAFAGWWRYAEPKLVSSNAAGEPGDDWSGSPSISYDGRFVAFESRAANLSPDDSNLFGDGNRDVFARDMQATGADLVSLTPEGALDPDRGARGITISDDGRYAAFFTGRDMVPEDTNGGQDVYVKDLMTGEYTWAELTGDGSSPGRSVWELLISGNGEYVLIGLWDTDLVPEDTNGDADVYLWSRLTGEVTLVSETPAEATEPNRGARPAGISADGRYVGFYTGRDFVPEDINGGQDLYVKDMETGEYTWADLTGDGSSPGSGIWDFEMSGNGEFIVFSSYSDLVPEDTNGRRDVYVWSRLANETTLVSLAPEGATETDRGSRSPSINDDGTLIAFFSGTDFVADDTNGLQDLYLNDTVSGAYERVIVTSDGSSPGDDVWDLAMSGDGEWLAFVWRVGDSDIKSMGAAYYDPSATDDVSAAKVSDEEQVYVIHLGSAIDPGAARVSGADRYGTSVAVSKSTFPDGAKTVIIATGANWPDAMCASALAGAVVGPILLTRPDGVPADVAAEIERLGAQHAYVVGGTTAVTEYVENQLNDMLTGYVFRLSGDDRYGTSRAVANRTINILGATYSGMALVTTGSNYPDALAAAPLASGLDWPILLARVDTGDVYVPVDTTGIMILGGEKAVPVGIESALKADLGDDAVDRVGGLTRYDTSAQIAQAGVDAGLLWNGVGVASGEAYPDALTGGAAAGLQRTVVLLTPPTALDAYAEAALEANKADIDSVRFFGGVNALSTAVENAVKAILGM
jgi:putative cell wall-binding protein